MATELHAGMHDNPSIFPTLPSKQPDEFAAWMGEVDHGIWQTCWEYVVTHSLTDGEGAAFWTAANLVREAMTASSPAPTANGAS